MSKTHESEPPPKSGESLKMLIDPLKLTMLSTMDPGSKSLEVMMPLNKYKFDWSRFAVVKQTPKCRNILLGSIEKPTVEGFEERILWDISGLDVARVGIETSVVIVGMALADQTSTEAMEKDISRLKQSTAQFQA